MEKNHLARRIGSRMKILRKQRGLTLHEIARQTRLSASLISRIENGLTMPSIQTLQFIADSLSTDIGYFFQQEVGNRYVVSRHGKRRVIPADAQSSGAVGDRRPLYDTEPLAEGMENPFMVPMILRVIRRKPKVNPAPHGGQEFLYVLEGKLLMTLGEEKITLSKGDALYFDGNIPHMGASLNRNPAKALVVHMVPGRRVRSVSI